MEKRLRVFLADDYSMVRQGLRDLLQSQEDLRYVGDDGDGWGAVSRADALQPDVAVLDVSMPGNSGIDMTRRLKELVPAAKILILTDHDDVQFLREAIRAGATGYVLKHSGTANLVEAIRAVASGGIYIDPMLASRLAGSPNRENALHHLLHSSPLSRREEDVLRLIANGYSNKEIAARMNVSVKTVETYRARSLRKLQLRSRVDIVRFAQRSGWLGGSYS